MALDVGLGTLSGQLPADRSQSIAEAYADLVALAVHAESRRFDSVWLASHHGHPAEHLSSPLVLLAGIATVTTQIRLGTAMVIAPLQEPIRFAEECATLDQLSGGRLAVGLAAGWRPEEFAMFDVPMTERATRTAALARFCRAAWDTGAGELDGRRVVVHPRPAGRIPVVMGGSAPGALRRAGRLADVFIATGTPAIGLDALLGQVRVIDEAAVLAGRSPDDVQLGFQANCWVSRDGRLPDPVRQAMWNQIGASLAAHAGTPDRPAFDAGELARRAVIGAPGEVVQQLAPWITALRDRNPRLVARLHYPGLDRRHAADAIELFAAEVMPRLRELAS